ncbi:YagK/YfjJ domain-containing protein [Aliikangiella sp. IMCC44653]
MSKKPREWVKQHTIKKRHFIFNGLKWPIQSSHGGINKRHLERIFSQTDVMLTIYSKLLIVRFDLHMPAYTDDNKLMVIFKRRLFKRIKAKYSLNDIAYFWCREYEKGKGQHYHWALMVDGKKVRSGFPINDIVEKVWNELNGTTHKGGYHNVSRKSHEKQQIAIEHLSYLAKTRTKSYCADYVKSFSSSKISYPDGEINFDKGLLNIKKMNSV